MIEEVVMQLALPRILVVCLFVFLAGFAREGLAKSPAQSREGLLLVAFGTSVPEAVAAFDAIDASFKAAFPNARIRWAYTSQIIRKKLAAQGKKTGGIGEGLAQLARDGVKVVRVQSLHVMAGEEFAALERAVLLDLQKNPGRFEAVYLGRPLLESRQDAEDVVTAVLDDVRSKRQKGDAVVLMGHGQEHGRAGLAFEGARAAFKARDPLVFMATVEGARGYDELLAELKAHKVQKVWLQPFMIVAGEHARNDLAGDEEDSWASRLKAAGFTVEANLKGLGLVPGVPAIFERHAREDVDDLTREPKKQ